MSLSDTRGNCPYAETQNISKETKEKYFFMTLYIYGAKVHKQKHKTTNMKHI